VAEIIKVWNRLKESDTGMAIVNEYVEEWKKLN